VNRHQEAVPSTLEDIAAQDASLRAQCPLCGAAQDAYCVNPITGRHLPGEVSHFQRIKAARTQETT
jgi:hypothetical protein